MDSADRRRHVRRSLEDHARRRRPDPVTRTKVMQKWRASFTVVLATPIELCLERMEANPRPGNVDSEAAIRKWWSDYRPVTTDRVVEFGNGSMHFTQVKYPPYPKSKGVLASLCPARSSVPASFPSTKLKRSFSFTAKI